MKQLFDAIKAGDGAAVQFLLDSDASLVDAVDENGASAITVAAYNRKSDIADLLRERGARLDVFSASLAGDENRLRELLAEDKSLAAAFSRDGWTALHLAAFFGHTPCAKALVEAGAPVNARSTNAMKNLPIHAAVAGRKVDLVILLAESGAAVNAQQHGGWTPMHAAAQNGDINIVHVLIGTGAQVHVAADNAQTPLDLAMLKGNQDMVDILEHYGSAA